MGHTIINPLVKKIVGNGGGGNTPEEVYAQTRPSNWPDMPETNFNESYMLVNLVESTENLFAINVTSSTNYKLDIIDGGNVTTFENQSGIFQTEINWFDITNPADTNGNKQVLVKVYDSVITNIDYTQIHSNISNVLYWFSPILEIKSNYDGDFTVRDRSRNLTYFNFIGNYTPTTLLQKFINCSSLITLFDFDITNVTSMFQMFNACLSLLSVPLFDTINVTSMSTMFQNCNSLVSVPLFNTINVTNMTNMFNGCNSLLSVPLFDTSNVTIMQTMFDGCNSLVSVPLFNTKNVTNMNSMFQNCNSLVSVPLFNTINVTLINQMFNGCNSLISVPLFNTTNVTNMQNMFSGCSSLVSVPLFDTSNVTTMSGVFSNCNSLVSVTLFDTTNAITMTSMFITCTSLKKIENIDLSSITSSINMRVIGAISAASAHNTYGLTHFSITENSTLGNQGNLTMTLFLTRTMLNLDQIEKIGSDLGAYTGTGVRTLNILDTPASDQLNALTQIEQDAFVEVFTNKNYVLTY